MSFGLKIFRDDGSLWISPDVTPLNYIGKVNFSSAGTFTTTIPSNKNLMIFLRNTTAASATRVTTSNSGAFWVITIAQTNSGGVLYLFSNMVLNTSGWGVAVYNSVGEMVWNTDMLPLQMFMVNNPYGVSQSGNFSVETGVQVAVTPGVCSTYIAVIDAPRNIFLWGVISAGAFGTRIYGVRTSGVQVEGQKQVWKYKESFLCIDISKYP
ncbi:hypothetical protein [Kluyvera huaxiensis]|uniref:hypothetical protein n=1 Tax=Kluyvera sp. 142053 TaxID=3160979 RepID=UPI0032DFD07D